VFADALPNKMASPAAAHVSPDKLQQHKSCVSNPITAESCRDWTMAIKEVPSGLAAGFSRLASPPPNMSEDAKLPSSWEEEDELPATESVAIPPLSCAAPPLLDASMEVPETWESQTEVGPVVGSQTDEGSAVHLTANVDVIPLLSNVPVAQESNATPEQGLFIRPQAPLLPCPAPVMPQRHQDEKQPVSEA
jgi:hypothetical protein